jgi:hypothetical protein
VDILLTAGADVNQQFCQVTLHIVDILLTADCVYYVGLYSWEITILCTYDLYSPVHNVLDACISITRGSGRGLGPGIQEFFGPCEMTSS